MSNFDDYLVTKKVTEEFKGFNEIYNLYDTAFPAVEKIPIQLLMEKAKNENVKFKAYYDDDIFVGFSYVISSASSCFVLFLATNPQIRSKGYGSRILKMIKDDNKGKEISLNVEKIDETASNNEQRKKRVEFYLRNGFKDSGYVFNIKSFLYSVLTTSDDLDVSAYIELLRSLKGSTDLPNEKNAMGEFYKRIF